MRITLNGCEQVLERDMTIRELMTEIGLEPESVASALNGDFVPRSRFDVTRVREGDEVEFLRPISGG